MGTKPTMLLSSLLHLQRASAPAPRQFLERIQSGRSGNAHGGLVEIRQYGAIFHRREVLETCESLEAAFKLPHGIIRSYVVFPSDHNRIELVLRGADGRSILSKKLVIPKHFVIGGENLYKRLVNQLNAALSEF